ncbi:MAG TPA: energy-coupling factor transporter transmembrane protein EcfT [Clostridiales bacterium]|jgi:energy-coupling factor transport system permease protein|nr:energy-coupling factor transporter transmembrane protein EcfT [Clostridiales bacterium]
MLKEITLGQFFPGDSPLHKTDPRAKIILTLLYIIGIFTAKNVFAFLFVVLFTLFLIVLCKIPLRIILKGMKPVIYVVAFTAVINIFWTKGETPLFEFGIIRVYPEGLKFAGLMIIRIIALLAGTGVVLTYTTSPIALTDGLERLLGPLKKLRMPVHEFSMMMTIALRFIPTLIEETDKIMSAQKARGADFSQGSLVNRAKALIPVMIPLFVSAFRRADDLAVAMECRCYRGDVGRTRMTELHMKPLDWLMVLIFMIFIAGIILLNIFAPGFSI